MIKHLTPKPQAQIKQYRITERWKEYFSNIRYDIILLIIVVIFVINGITIYQGDKLDIKLMKQSHIVGTLICCAYIFWLLVPKKIEYDKEFYDLGCKIKISEQNYFLYYIQRFFNKFSKVNKKYDKTSNTPK